jgi:hypothetical protein
MLGDAVIYGPSSHIDTFAASHLRVDTVDRA